MKPSRFRFRAWDANDKIMYGVTHIDTNGNGETMINGQKICSDKVILMQSTGFVDCKGDTIYEGDIVQQISYCPETDEESVHTWIVQWGQQLAAGFEPFISNCSDCGVGGCIERGCGCYTNMPAQMEVIGNIYEHGLIQQ